ncbi:hypothetical protein FRB93_013235 [Tulasnella sp. JGI-2019a]|nr:hypothetical protein FRB93_013235 [Tulasnella sp. JGI-2019a]
MSTGQGANLPSIHSVLDPFSGASSYNVRNSEPQDAGQMNMHASEDDMDIDTEAPTSKTAEVQNAVPAFESMSIEAGGAEMPPGNIPVNGLPRLTLSSSDSGLIIIQKRVALGHHSDMYQGLYTPTKLKLAMKCPRILEGTFQAVDTKRRYEREVRTWSSLNHVNVLPFYGVVEISSVTYLVAPWVAHGDLSQFLAARLKCLKHPSLAHDSVSIEKRAAFLIFDEAATIHGIASGLVYLHACGLIHGDIKAANVLMTDSLVPLLGDFGLTKKDEANVTSPGSKGSGTARWKSPGLTDGESRTTKTDIYALGMTIVEILTCREPFHQLRLNAKVYLAVSQGHRPPFEPLSCHGKDFGLLWELAACCWQKEAVDRPTAAQVVGRIAPLLPTTSLGHITMEIGSCVSSDVVPLRSTQVNRRSNMLGDQSMALLPGSVGGARKEPENSAVDRMSKDTGNKKSAMDTDNSNGNDGRQEHEHDMCNSVIEAAAIYRKLNCQGMVAHCLRTVSEMKKAQGHYDDDCTLLNEVYAIYMGLGDRSMMAYCLESVGEIRETQGRYDDAKTSMSEAASIYKALDDRPRVAQCLKSIGVIKESQGNYADACTSLIEAAVIFKSLEDRGMAAHCLKSIGDIKETQGRFDEALTSLSESYAIFKELDDRGAMARCLESIGSTNKKQRDYNNACTSLGEATAIYKQLGDRRRMAHCLKSIVKIKEVQGHCDDACTLLSEQIRGIATMPARC